MPNRAGVPGRAPVRGYLASLAAWLASPLRRSAGLARLRHDDQGATAVEYALIIALIAAVIVVVVGLLGGQVSSAFANMANTF